MNLNKFLKTFKNNFLIWVIYLICATIFVSIWWAVLGGISLCICGILFVFYGFCAAANGYGMRKLIEYERAGILDLKKSFSLSIMSMCPMYFCWTLTAFIPIVRYEVWFITCFPVILLTLIPAWEVKEYIKKDHQLLFWVLQIVIYLPLLTVGQLIVCSVSGS